LVKRGIHVFGQSVCRKSFIYPRYIPKQPGIILVRGEKKIPSVSEYERDGILFSDL
jgi:hypothetical protein